MSMIPSENLRVADRLREASQLLAARGASRYRIDAYRHAADSIAQLPRDVRRVYEAEGIRGLDAIHRVGLGIASAVAEMLVGDRWAELERLRGSANPVELFRGVAGIGPRLARRIHERLGIESLEALEIAARDGRLARLAGVGERRAGAIRAVVAEMIGARNAH